MTPDTPRMQNPMPLPSLFPATREAALARLAAVRPDTYARSRNALDGAVTRLSPYLSHGLLSLPEAYAGIAAGNALPQQHKLVYEFGWRAFFRHVWTQRGNGILKSLHAGPLPDSAYAGVLPMDIREGRTGVPVIDQAVRELYACGYLHNHARMWLASYVVHLRKVHWRAGADWMYAHLLDGDLGSNHLSWQWVAATGSHKPYLFNADNVARFAPPQWHSPGSVVDASYEALEQLAREPRSVSVLAGAPGIEEPALLSAPPAALGFCTPAAGAAAGSDVWLVHPWALGDPPADLPDGTLVIAANIAEWHLRWPWSETRWQFAGTRQRALASACWHAGRDALRAALAGAHSVHTQPDPHLGDLLESLHPAIVWHQAPDLFESASAPCHSFSAWWRHARLILPASVPAAAGSA